MRVRLFEAVQNVENQTELSILEDSSLTLAVGNVTEGSNAQSAWEVRHDVALGWFLVAGALVFWCGSAHAATTYIKIVDNATGFTSFAPPLYSIQPAINNNGTVAFWGQPFLSPYHGIFKGNGGPLTMIATSQVASGSSSLGSAADINDAGSVAFSRAVATTGIYTGSGGPISTVEDSTGPRRNLGRTLINNAGSVAFTAMRDTGNSNRGSYIKLVRGTSLVGELNSSGASVTHINFDATSVNASGQVAIVATGSLAVVGNPAKAIYVGNGGPLSLVTERPAGFGTFLGEPSINDVGDVSYIANVVGGSGIALYSGGTTTLLLSSGGATGISLNGDTVTRINNDGDVAFEESRGGVFGIFVGSNSTFDPVVSIGDALFGSTITSLAGWDFNVAVMSRLFTSSRRGEMESQWRLSFRSPARSHCR